MTAAPRRTLVVGGARSGKSGVAERLLAGIAEVVYVATGGERLDDPEWVARVAAHRAARPPTWRTVETTDLSAALRQAPAPGGLLIDCLTLWLTAAMDDCGAWDDVTWPAGDARKQLDAAIDEFVDAWRRAAPGHLVAVSNEVGWGVVPPTVAGRRFQDEMGRLNQRIAAESDEVLLVVAGRTLQL